MRSPVSFSPQDIILDELEERNIKVSSLSQDVQDYLDLNGGELTVTIIEELVKVTNLSPEFFDNLQTNYNEWLATERPPLLQ